jgi:selenide, water dikinase
VNPARVLSNAGARPGDRLVLTKRIGTGIISTAVKSGAAAEEANRAAIDSMSTLNRAASETALQFAVHAATDITGFGFLGHARGMAAASHVSMVMDHLAIDFLPDARDLARRKFLPGGLKRNIEFISGCVDFAESVPEDIRNLLYDPQTSGGLLLAVSRDDSARLVESLRANQVSAQEIGEVVVKTKPLLRVQ